MSPGSGVRVGLAVLAVALSAPPSRAENIDQTVRVKTANAKLKVSGTVERMAIEVRRYLQQ